MYIYIYIYIYIYCISLGSLVPNSVDRQGKIMASKLLGKTTLQ